MINVKTYDESLNDIYTYDKLLVYMNMNLPMGRYRKAVCVVNLFTTWIMRTTSRKRSSVTMTINNTVIQTAQDIEDPRLISNTSTTRRDIDRVQRIYWYNEWHYSEWRVMWSGTSTLSLNDRSAALGEVIEFKGRVYYNTLEEPIDSRWSECERTSVYDDGPSSPYRCCI